MYAIAEKPRFLVNLSLASQVEEVTTSVDDGFFMRIKFLYMMIVHPKSIRMTEGSVY